jgi:hypothetical protein
VIVETCFFLDAKGKGALLDWVAKRGLKVVDIPIDGSPLLAYYIKKYADQDIDFADAALVWSPAEPMGPSSSTLSRSILPICRCLDLGELR